MVKRRWRCRPGEQPTDFDKRIMYLENKGALVPTRELVKTPEQIEGIRRAGVVNTGVLDAVAEAIHAGMSTLEIDRICRDYCDHFTTILDGYYADASRMFIIGKTTPEKEQLVRVTKECLEIGMEAAKPWGFVNDIGRAIEKHARKYHYGVVRDLCGHGVGNAFHEEPDVAHFAEKDKGMLLVPGMVFTIEPMINMGTWKVFIDGDDPYGWEVISEDELPSAQWEHTLLMTEHGVEVLTY